MLEKACIQADDQLTRHEPHSMPRILIIEDQEKLRRNLQQLIEQEQFEAMTAETGEEGFHLATTQAFDVIILDLSLPRRNGLENAVKFTPENGTVEVTVRNLPEGVHLQVRDTGCGISQSDLPRVFDRFYRDHSKIANLPPGSGLGLSIVKSIVTSHHGTVDISSTPSEGTMISIVLPAVAR